MLVASMPSVVWLIISPYVVVSQDSVAIRFVPASRDPQVIEISPIKETYSITFQMSPPLRYVSATAQRSMQTLALWPL